MPFTRPWDKNTPAGTIPAKQIDDEIRKVREDVEERLGTIFVDPTTDPLVVKDAITGKIAGKILTIGAGDFHTDSGTVVLNANNIQAYNNTGPLQTSFDIPPGCTITKIESLCDRGANTQVIVTIYKNTFAVPPASVVLSTMNHVGAGITLLDSGVLAEVVTDSTYYTVNVEGQAGGSGVVFAYYGLRITYTTPDSRYTR